MSRTAKFLGDEINDAVRRNGGLMKITDSKSLGRAIRERRKDLNYTQAYLADFTGLSVSFISDLERGKPTAEIEKTIRLINILGMDVFVEKRG